MVHWLIANGGDGEILETNFVSSIIDRVEKYGVYPMKYARIMGRVCGRRNPERYGSNQPIPFHGISISIKIVNAMTS